jgi:hypothetical protein
MIENEFKTLEKSFYLLSIDLTFKINLEFQI